MSWRGAIAPLPRLPPGYTTVFLTHTHTFAQLDLLQMPHTNMIMTEIYKPFVLCMLLSGTSGIPCLEQSSSNLACIPLLPIEAILSHEC